MVISEPKPQVRAIPVKKTVAIGDSTPKAIPVKKTVVVAKPKEEIDEVSDEAFDREHSTTPTDYISVGADIPAYMRKEPNLIDYSKHIIM